MVVKKKRRKIDLGLYPDPLSRIASNLLEFRKLLDCQQEFMIGVKSLRAYSDQLVELNDVVDRAVNYLDMYRNGDWKLADLEFELASDIGEALEDLLNSSPILVRRFPANMNTEMEGLIEDFQILAERLFEGIRQKGFDLYHILIGAA